jgi:Mg2+ and Co2+ transporter CorA
MGRISEEQRLATSFPIHPLLTIYLLNVAYSEMIKKNFISIFLIHLHNYIINENCNTSYEIMQMYLTVERII